MIWPIEESQLAETVATWAISLGALDLLGRLVELVGHCGGRLADPALQADRIASGGDALRVPRRTIDSARHGGGGRAVAGDVVGLGSDFADQLGAHVLNGIGQFDFLGDGDAVLGDRGEPQLLERTTLRPAGPRVDLTALVRISAPARSFWRAASSKMSFLADIA